MGGEKKRKVDGMIMTFPPGRLSSFSIEVARK